MATLYELTEQYQYLYDLYSDGDIDEQTLNDSLDGMMFDEQLENKAEGYVKVIKSLEADASASKVEADRLLKRINILNNNADRLKNALYNAMLRINTRIIKTPLFSINIQSTQEKVVINNINTLQNHIQYWKSRKWDESELNKTAIKKALLAGIEVPGAHLEKGKSLRIR